MILMTKCLSYANNIPQAFSLSCTLFPTYCEILAWCLLPKSQELPTLCHFKDILSKVQESILNSFDTKCSFSTFERKLLHELLEIQDRVENATLLVQQKVNVNATLAITVTLCINHQMCQRSDILATKWSRHVLTLCNPDFHHLIKMRRVLLQLFWIRYIKWDGINQGQ